jgi:hypothetical protein
MMLIEGMEGQPRHTVLTAWLTQPRSSAETLSAGSAKGSPVALAKCRLQASFSTHSCLIHKQDCVTATASQRGALT